MKLSVSETAKLMGVSVRTLHYYDDIGLLKPTETTQSGYRYYDNRALEILQQILFYRELNFSLKDIADIISRPDYDKQLALSRHRELLLLKREHIDALIELLDETIGGYAMKKSKVTAADIDAVKAKYAAEAKEKWGKTAEYAESQKRYESYTDEQKVSFAEDADRIFASFAKLMDRAPGDKEVQELVGQWQEHITKYYYPCTREILSCLGQMYVSDQRFADNINRFGDGNARFISKAIAFYCRQ